jgi:uncharacterized protein
VKWRSLFECLAGYIAFSNRVISNFASLSRKVVFMPRLEYFAPGVYVEEINRGSRPIEGISMSVAGFVGFTEDVRGDAELFSPMLITSWDQYLEYFSTLGSDGYTSFGAYLPFAVKGWFDNGGGRCWVVSIGTQAPPDDEQSSATSSSANVREPAVGAESLTIAKTAGKRNALAFQIKERPGERAEDNLRLKVVIESDEPSLPASLDEEEAFDTGEFFKIRVIQGDVQDYEELEVFRHLTMERPESVSPSDETEPVSPSSEEPVTIPPGGGIFVETALRQSQWINVQAIAPAGLPLAQRPANGLYEVAVPPVPYPMSRLYQKIYGAQKARTGMMGLFEIDEVAMIACPDLMLAYQKNWLDLDQVHAVMQMMITNCENAAPSPPYRMVVLDPPPVKPRKGSAPVLPRQMKPQDVAEWLDEHFGRRSQFAALYYPWVQVANPRENGKPIMIPPCGHMMGLWCQTDETRGVYKAPANVVPRGVLGLAYDTNFREQEMLNPKGINCIRKFKERGTLVWGARTLAERSDVDWRYISVRRLMSFISKSIENGTQWAVFEPNDEDLWARVTRTVSNFLERLWREGALFWGNSRRGFLCEMRSGSKHDGNNSDGAFIRRSWGMSCSPSRVRHLPHQSVEWSR